MNRFLSLVLFTLAFWSHAMLRFHVLMLVAITFVTKIDDPNLRTAEPEACPYPWMVGVFQYTDSTGEKSIVTFTQIDDNSIRGDWLGAKGETATEIAGWQPGAKRLVVAGFESDGTFWNIEAKEVHGSGFSGQGVFGERDGSLKRGDFELKAKNNDSSTTLFKGKDEKGADVTFEGRFERIGHTSTREEFEEFGNLLAGRWMGDITLIADWPGEVKKQGDKITAYATYQWIADGSGIEWSDVGGMGTSKTLIAYDAAAKTIRSFNLDAGGGTWQSTIWKKSDTDWGWIVANGSLNDGRKLTGQGSWLIEDKGNQHIIQGAVQLDGEELPKLHDVYTRVNKISK